MCIIIICSPGLTCHDWLYSDRNISYKLKKLAKSRNDRIGLGRFAENQPECLFRVQSKQVYNYFECLLFTSYTRVRLDIFFFIF